MPRKSERRNGLPSPAFSAQQVTSDDVAETVKMVREYASPYVDLMTRSEQGAHLVSMLTGLSSNLERKSVEPIAVMVGTERRLLQSFVGASKWDWEPLRDLQRREVAREIGIPDGALIFDGSATPKKGVETVGVSRQYCGRLGKIDNCVIGVYAAYLGKSDLTALVESQLFLPKDWAKDKQRRRATHVPVDVKYRSQPAIAKEMLEALAPALPFSWVMADDEFGRVRAFRDAIRKLGRNYIVDVPENTSVRKVSEGGTLGFKEWNLKELIKRCPVDAWQYIRVRNGQKGPIEVRALKLPVATKREATKRTLATWAVETLVVIEMTDGSQRWCCLASAPTDTPLAEFVRRAGQRHRVEETFGEAKGEVGLDHFEVRGWQGWHHHMTLCQIAHWFLVREKRRLGKKSRRGDGQHDPHDPRATAIASAHHGDPRPTHELPPEAQPRRSQREVPLPWARASTSSSDAMTGALQP